MSETLLMDTHVWIWLMQGEKISTKLKDRLEQAAEKGKLTISAISVWELTMLVQKGRIQLSQDIHQFIEQALENIRCINVTASIALTSNFLPETFHADPGDRMIVATARELGAYLVTGDEKILAYAQQGHLKVIPL